MLLNKESEMMENFTNGKVVRNYSLIKDVTKTKDIRFDDISETAVKVSDKLTRFAKLFEHHALSPKGNSANQKVLTIKIY